MNERKTKLALVTVALGLWMLAVTLTFDPMSNPIYYSNIVSGILLICFGIASLSPQRIWSGWCVGLIGFWLQISPLVFWAPCSSTYLNDTFVGLVLIVISFLLTEGKEKTGSVADHYPTGWSFNPSGWILRIPTVALAMLCWFFSRYMAAYQLGYIDHMWDPIFKDGTLDVITSKISRDFPVSDAGLGALSYTLEAMLGWQGKQDRWYSMPWLVLIFGFLVVPVGAVSIILIILQPVAVGAWCSWCLATAAIMLVMILLTAPEFVATIQLLIESVRSGKSFWHVVWRGDASKERRNQVKVKRASSRKVAVGVTMPWNLVVTTLLGIWLMMAPSIFKTKGDIATVQYIAGPLLIAFSVAAMAEVFRAVRFVNVLLGLILIGAFWLWPEAAMDARINALIVGLATLVVSFRRGPVVERYGMWEKFII
ncbi:MAG: vitamin K epoxide reductase family protein [Rhabdochlamydiaceae bacterium]|nr:vitamin K epoxide reductase family protein [Rhabdochlamydiaceae bacterium]